MTKREPVGSMPCRSRSQRRMHGMRRCVLAWVVLAVSAGIVGPSPLLGQDGKLERVRGAYAPEAVEEIEALLGEARGAGVPEGPLLDKALEGAAKGVPPSRVVPALRGYLDRMSAARTALGGSPEPGWIVAGADALRRGLSPDAVGELGREAGDHTPIALVAAGDLVEAGVPLDRAMAVLREAMRAGDQADRILDASATVRHLMRQGDRPPDAARRVVRAIRDGRPLHRLRGGPPPDAATGARARPVPPGSEPPTTDRTGRDGRRRGGARSGSGG